MATNMPNVGGRVVLEGEKEYRAALSNINAGLKVNYTQMGLVAAQADATSDSQEGLRNKIDALKNTISSQTEKVELMRAQLALSTKKTGESSTATMKYKADLNKAETELQKMQNELGGYKTSLEKSTTATSSMSGVLNGMLDTMGISAPPAMQSMIDNLDGVSASGAAAATAIVGITVALGKLTEDEAKHADELLTLSSQTGLTTDQLQEFEYASELVDVSTETLQGSLRKLTKNMDTARGGTGEAAEAFNALGVSITDSHGNLRAENDVFMDCIDALGKVKNGTEADALSMAIFGKSAQDLNPLIDAGSETLRKLGEEAYDVGYVKNPELIDSLGDLDDANQRWIKKMDAVKSKLAEGLLPVLTGIMDVLNAIPTPVLTGITVAGGVIAVLTLIAKAARDMAVANAILSASNVAVGATATTATAGLSAMLPALLLIAAIAIGVGGVAAIVSAVGNNAKTAANAATAAQNQRHNARGSQYFEGGGTWVGEDGPEYVDLPRGSRIYPNGQMPKGGTSTSTVNNYYTFKVDDIATYQQIEQKLKNEQTSIRQGVSN